MQAAEAGAAEIPKAAATMKAASQGWRHRPFRRRCGLLDSEAFAVRDMACSSWWILRTYPLLCILFADLIIHPLPEPPGVEIVAAAPVQRSASFVAVIQGRLTSPPITRISRR